MSSSRRTIGPDRKSSRNSDVSWRSSEIGSHLETGSYNRKQHTGSNNRKEQTGRNNSAKQKPSLMRAASDFLSKAKDSVTRLAKVSVNKVWSVVTWRGQGGTDSSPPVVTLHTY